MDTTPTKKSNEDGLKQSENTRLKEKPSPSSKLNSLFGVLELPNNFDEETELRDYFENKHL